MHLKKNMMIIFMHTILAASVKCNWIKIVLPLQI